VPGGVLLRTVVPGRRLVRWPPLEALQSSKIGWSDKQVSVHSHRTTALNFESDFLQILTKTSARLQKQNNQFCPELCEIS
jgi:hypothetical protein